MSRVIRCAGRELLSFGRVFRIAYRSRAAVGAGSFLRQIDPGVPAAEAFKVGDARSGTRDQAEQAEQVLPKALARAHLP